MKKSGLILALFLMVSVAFAQRGNQKWYLHAVGVSTGNSIYNFMPILGMSYDRFVSNQNSIELILSSDLATGTEITGYYKYIKSIPGVPASVRWYCGVGIHAAKWDATGNTGGPDGLLGIGYTFDQLPFNATFDWRPSVNIGSDNTAYVLVPTKFALTARYIIE